MQDLYPAPQQYLYLARFTRFMKRYPDGPERQLSKQPEYRAIWACSPEQAAQKLEAALAPPAAPGDDSYWLRDVEIFETIE